MTDSHPQNALHERYASPQMARLFSARHRYGLWREVWIALAEAQRELGLPIRAEQIARLREVAPDLDLERVAEIEAETRHDVVAHLRHFAEQAAQDDQATTGDRATTGDQATQAGGILHLGATSAFVTDNVDAILLRDGLRLLEGRLAAAPWRHSPTAHDRFRRSPTPTYSPPS